MVADAMWLALVIALVVGTCAIDRETGMLWNSFDGSIYQGEYIRGYMFGTRDGKGAQRWYRSGNGYEGDFVGNMKHGHGTETHNCVLKEEKESGAYFCHSYYEGDYNNNQKHGFGSYVYSDGSSYSGEWLFGLWHGKGIIRYSNGITYSGDFFEGKKEGKGSLRMNSDNFFITGEWKDNVYQGTDASMTWQSDEENSHKYEGSWYYHEDVTWMTSIIDRLSHYSIPYNNK